MTEICTNFKIDDLDWEKCEHMIPVIVQHYRSGLVLMQGFMNREALEKTLATGKVTLAAPSNAFGLKVKNHITI